MRGYKNFESDPHPGDLRHKIEIGYTENTVNENGYPEPRDVVVCRVWAAVTDAGNQHYRSADVMNTEAVINFTIRFREDIHYFPDDVQMILLLEIDHGKDLIVSSLVSVIVRESIDHFVLIPLML